MTWFNRLTPQQREALRVRQRDYKRAVAAKRRAARVCITCGGKLPTDRDAATCPLCVSISVKYVRRWRERTKPQEVASD